ncbi:eukaryotic translation initiation factor 4 gamma 1-like isoform X1 [Argonauta hians]
MSKQGFTQQTRLPAASGVSSQNMFQPPQNVRSPTGNLFTTPQNVQAPRNFSMPHRSIVYGYPATQTTSSYSSPAIMNPNPVMSAYTSNPPRISTPSFSNQPQQPFQMPANPQYYPATPNPGVYFQGYPMPRPQQKRSKNKIPIINPVTGKDISDEIKNARPAADGSPGGGSVCGDMRAQFAALVAATLKSPNPNVPSKEAVSMNYPLSAQIPPHAPAPQMGHPQSMPQRPVTPQGQRRQTSKSPPVVLLESKNVNLPSFSGPQQKLPDNSCYIPAIPSKTPDLLANQPLSPPDSPPAQQIVNQAKHPPQIYKNSQQQPQIPEQPPTEPRINTSLKSMPQASKRVMPASQVSPSICQPQPQFIANLLPSDIPQAYLPPKVSEVVQNTMMAPVSGLLQQTFNSSLDLENADGVIKSESYNEVNYPDITKSGALKKDDSQERQPEESSPIVEDSQTSLPEQPLPADEATSPEPNQQETVPSVAVKPANVATDDIVNETKENPLKAEETSNLDEVQNTDDKPEKSTSDGVESSVDTTKVETTSVLTPPENAEEISPKDSKKEKANETVNSAKTDDAEIDDTGKPEDTETEVKDSVKEPETASVTEEKEVDEEAKDVKKVVINIEDKVVADENQKNDAKNSEEGLEESESILGFKYKEDQWSPLHPERKKQYDREFLLNLQFANESRSKPLGLPDLPDVILNKPHEPERSFEKVSAPGSFDRGFDLMPKYMRASKTSGSVRNIPKRGSQQGNIRKDGKKIIAVSLSEGPLKRCDNAWKPPHKASKDEDDEDDIYKKVRSILNKLTPQNFEVLLSQIRDIDINTENKLKILIGLLFEKAISEPSFSVAYANLCSCLLTVNVPSSAHSGMVNFRDTLLNRCQVEFEKHSSEEADLIKKQKEIESTSCGETRRRLKEELDEAFSAAKRRSIGNIRFIGELFKLRMLTEKIMHDCVSNLLKSRDEESLECLCRLLKTVGKEVDSDVSKSTMKVYFQEMKDIVNEKKTSSRVRFMLQDAIELRENNWIPRRAENNPKTIHEIHLEAEQEEKERKQNLENAAAKQRNYHHRGVGNGGSNTGMNPGPGARGSQSRGSSMSAGGEDGWNTVTRSRLDINKLRLPMKRDDDVKLGPGGPVSAGWGRGSLGPLKGSQESERPGNRFYPLRGNDDEGRGQMYLRRGGSPGRSDVGRPLTSSSSASSSGSRSKISSFPSVESDKDSGLGARNIPKNSKTLPSSVRRESSQSREETEKESTVMILKDFYSSTDYEEAKLSIEGLPNRQKFIVHAFNCILERTAPQRELSGKLLAVLMKEKIIDVESFTQGFMEILDVAEDMKIDIPKIWQYLGELIRPMIQNGSIPLNILKTVCEPFKKSRLAAILPCEVLKDLLNTVGQDKTNELWQSSKLKWSDFLEEKDIDSFIKEKNLEFTLEATSKPSPGSLTMVNIESMLTDYLSESEPPESDVIAWIESRVSEQQRKDPLLIRAIMKAVCSFSGHGSKNQIPKLLGYCSLLKKYLKSKDDKVQALYALQLLDAKQQHPPSVLKNLFVALCENDVISKQAFISWKKSPEFEKSEGRGVALSQVSQFLKDLEDCVDDENDTDDS